MPTALITGITGQDGSYLAELLLSKGYRVIGVARRSSTVTNERIEHLLDDITVVQGDLHDQGSLLALLEEYEPTEVYNLAAQSFVPTSWNQPAQKSDDRPDRLGRVNDSGRQDGLSHTIDRDERQSDPARSLVEYFLDPARITLELIGIPFDGQL